MSEAPINLAEHRAVKASDSRLWTAADLLRAMLRDIENGEIKPDQIAVWYMEPTEDAGQRLHYAVAGMTRAEHVYLLNHALRRALSESVD